MIIDNASQAALAAYASSAQRKTTPLSDGSGSDAASIDSSGAAKRSDSAVLSSTSTRYSQAIAGYSAYFPARSGMTADALALGVSQPGAVSSSKGLSFADVASDARKRLDANYALMKNAGSPYDGSDTDRNALMGGLDRRSLYAVATNEGGGFSTDEQTAAKALMHQQERLASGYFSGPADQQKYFTDPYSNDPVARAQAALAFLDAMSPEEKNAPGWLTQHQTLADALAQTGASADDSTKKQAAGHFHNLSEILAGIDTDGSAT